MRRPASRQRRPHRTAMAWLVGLLALVAVSAPPAEATMPDGFILDFRVMRENEEIGRHWVRFRHVDDRLMVETQVRLAVKFAFLTVFHYEQDGQETWSDGRLVALESETNDNGVLHTVSAEANGSSIEIDANGASWNAPKNIIPSTLWHRDMLRSSPLLGVEQGNALVVEFEELGLETVMVRGAETSATHYRVKGDLERDVWYDEDGILVHLELKGFDGSDITYFLD